MFVIILRAFRTCSTPRLHELFVATELTFTTVLNRTVPKQTPRIKYKPSTFTTALNRTVPKQSKLYCYCHYSFTTVLNRTVIKLYYRDF